MALGAAPGPGSPAFPATWRPGQCQGLSPLSFLSLSLPLFSALLAFFPYFFSSLPPSSSPSLLWPCVPTGAVLIGNIPLVWSLDSHLGCVLLREDRFL